MKVSIDIDCHEPMQAIQYASEITDLVSAIGLERIRKMSKKLNTPIIGNIAAVEVRKAIDDKL
jgi:hypothetical protein